MSSKPLIPSSRLRCAVLLVLLAASVPGSAAPVSQPMGPAGEVPLPAAVLPPELPWEGASRSLMAHMAPVEMRTEMFGLFALSGKITAFLGPAMVAALTAATESQRIGMAAIIVLFVAGGIAMLGVREPDRAAPAVALP